MRTEIQHKTRTLRQRWPALLPTSSGRGCAVFLQRKERNSRYRYLLFSFSKIRGGSDEPVKLMCACHYQQQQNQLEVVFLEKSAETKSVGLEIPSLLGTKIGPTEMRSCEADNCYMPVWMIVLGLIDLRSMVYLSPISELFTTVISYQEPATIFEESIQNSSSTWNSTHLGLHWLRPLEPIQVDADPGKTQHWGTEQMHR